jgi:hypothetical protein
MVQKTTSPVRGSISHRCPPQAVAYAPRPMDANSALPGAAARGSRGDSRVRAAYVTTAVLAFTGVLLQLGVNIANDGGLSAWDSCPGRLGSVFDRIRQLTPSIGVGCCG